MKKLLALIIALMLLCSLFISTVYAATKDKLDIRELEEYGQPHYYLGAPIETPPNVEDATVSENEYSMSYEFKMGDDNVVIESGIGYYDNGSARIYMAYDEQNVYFAVEVEDKNYIKGSDGVSFNISFRDSGIGYDAITRMCFDIYQHAEAEEDDISTFVTRCRYLVKNEKGEWVTIPTVEGMEYITDISGQYNEDTQTYTFELEMYLKPILRFWENENEVNDLRMYLFPLIWMQGESAEGSGEIVRQGLMWNYYPIKAGKLKNALLADYSYSPPWLPSIVHFCENPKYTTPEETMVAITTVADTTTEQTTPFVTDEPNAPNDMAKGCGVTVLGASIAPFALAAIISVKAKKKDD